MGGSGPDGSGGPDGGIFVNQLLKMEDGLSGTDFGHRKFRSYSLDGKHLEELK